MAAGFVVEPGRDREDRVGHVGVPLDALEMQVEQADVVVVGECVHHEDAEVRDRGRAAAPARRLAHALAPHPALLASADRGDPRRAPTRRSARRAELGGVIVSPGPRLTTGLRTLRRTCGRWPPTLTGPGGRIENSSVSSPYRKAKTRYGRWRYKREMARPVPDFRPVHRRGHYRLRRGWGRVRHPSRSVQRWRRRHEQLEPNPHPPRRPS